VNPFRDARTATGGAHNEEGRDGGASPLVEGAGAVRFGDAFLKGRLRMAEWLD
jgi:hypothetical protein